MMAPFGEKVTNLAPRRMAPTGKNWHS